MDPEHSIIVVNFNGGSKLVECVASIFRFTSSFELILVDNRSTDHSVSRIEDEFPETIIVRNSKNVGFASANNIGIKRARGRWIVLLNPDTKVTNNWLSDLVKCGTSSSSVGIVTPKLVRMDGRTIDSTGHVFIFRTAYNWDRGAGEIDTGQYDTAEEVPSCCFACAAIRREVIDQIGLLDRKMVLYFEDVDYSIRTRIGGWRIMYCPDSVVFHVRGGVSPRVPSSLQMKSIAYRLRIILKCYARRDAVKYGMLRVARDFLAMAAGIKNNDVLYFLEYLRSPIWNALNPPIQERRLVQSTRKVSDESLMRLG